MKLTFTAEEMISSLKKMGYEVKEEKELETRTYYHHQVQEIERNVWNVYYNGEKFAQHAGYGFNRLEFVFKQELSKKLLNLF